MLGCQYLLRAGDVSVIQSSKERMTMTRTLIALHCAILFLAGCTGGTDTDAVPAARSEADRLAANKALARRWSSEVINQRNLDSINEIYTPDYVHHGPEGADLRGLDGVRAFAASILAASDDRHAVVEQQVAEGDLVVTRFTSSGHHTGVFRGVEPTGKVWTTEGISISRIEDGKVAEDWEIIRVSGL